MNVLSFWSVAIWHDTNAEVWVAQPSASGVICFAVCLGIRMNLYLSHFGEICIVKAAYTEQREELKRVQTVK